MLDIFAPYKWEALFERWPDILMEMCIRDRTKIVITMNVRELLHFFSLRCCNRAQWEIREMAHRMLELAKPTAPFVFMDAGAPCILSLIHI